MTLVSKQQKFKVEAICPTCGKKATISITQNELNKVKKEHGLIQKAILHKDHVVLIYVDGQCRIRRTYAYATENVDSSDKITNYSSKELKNADDIKDLNSLLDHMLKQSLNDE